MVLLIAAGVLGLFLMYLQGWDPAPGALPTNSVAVENGLARGENTSRDIGPAKIPLAPAPVEIPLVATPTNAEEFFVPVLWVGKAPDAGLTLPFVGAEGQSANASLDSLGILLPLPPDGEYQFGFSNAGIFAPDHRLIVAQRTAKLQVFQSVAESRLLLALATLIEVNVRFRGETPSEPSVEVRWFPARWPTGVTRPVRTTTIAAEMPQKLVVPTDGIEFQATFPGSTLISPRPPRFVPGKPFDSLEIVMGALIPVYVDVVEDTPGQWSQTRESRASRVLVSILAQDMVTGASPTLDADKLVERPETGYLPPGVAERFVVYAPPPEHDCELHAIVKAHGGGLEAIGKAVAGPNSREVRILAPVVGRCELLVIIKNEQAEPLEGVSVLASVHVAVAVLYAAGPQQRVNSDASGRARFAGLAVGEHVSATIILPAGYSSRAAFSPVSLASPGQITVEVIVATDFQAKLEVRVSGGKAWRPSDRARLVVMEGDRAGNWSRMTDESVLIDGPKAVVPVNHEHALVMLHCGECILTRGVTISGSGVPLEFNLDETTQVKGVVSRQEFEAAWCLIPGGVAPSLAWASIQSGECRLPHVPLAQTGVYVLRTDAATQDAPALVASRAGEVRWLNSLGDERNPGVKQVESSVVELSFQAPAKAEARDLTVILCPVFEEDGRSLSAELGLSRQIKIDDPAKSVAISLPHDRYVAFLTWVDTGGALRFGFGAGNYAEFTSRPGLKTQVKLPLP